MDILCAVGTVEQAEQPNYLAEGRTPIVTCNFVQLEQLSRPSSQTTWLRIEPFCNQAYMLII
eukprot:199422-Pelagomonas_calceolata.AAC.2